MERRAVARDHFMRALPGKPTHRIITAMHAKEAKGAHSHVVIGHVEHVAALVGEREHASRATAPANRRGSEGPML